MGVVRCYLTHMKTRMSSKGQIVLPAELREQDLLKAGEEFEVERLDRNQYLLKRLTPPRNRGLLQLLLSCPSKGWFKPLDRKQTTDDLNFSIDT